MFLYIYITKGFISLYIYVLAFLFNHVYMSIRDVPYREVFILYMSLC